MDTQSLAALGALFSGVALLLWRAGAFVLDCAKATVLLREHPRKPP